MGAGRRLRLLFPAPVVFARGLKLLFSRRSFLNQSGYTESVRQKRPCDRAGAPIPWMNYQVVHFLNERLHGGLSLFEYGSGYSTRYYASRVGHVTSVEHHPEWYRTVEAMKPDNVELIFQDTEVPDAYCGTVARSGKQYDVVIVDGQERVRCLTYALSSLSSAGVIILDDSLRESYTEGMNRVVKQGFRKLDFLCLKPGGINSHQTTIFYRDDNCLGL